MTVHPVAAPVRDRLSRRKERTDLLDVEERGNLRLQVTDLGLMRGNGLLIFINCHAHCGNVALDSLWVLNDATLGAVDLLRHDCCLVVHALLRNTVSSSPCAHESKWTDLVL